MRRRLDDKTPHSQQLQIVGPTRPEESGPDERAHRMGWFWRAPLLWVGKTLSKRDARVKCISYMSITLRAIHFRIPSDERLPEEYSCFGIDEILPFQKSGRRWHVPFLKASSQLA